jgi:hypothetical protein
MRKANATIYVAAALGLCLMSPSGAAPLAAPDLGKAYVQTAKSENLVPVRHVRHHAYRHHRVYRRGYWGSPFAIGLGWGWPLGYGLAIGPGVSVWGGGWGYPYYRWGSPYYYGGYYRPYYRGGCCYW